MTDWISSALEPAFKNAPAYALLLVILLAVGAGVYFVVRNRQRRIEELEGKIDQKNEKIKAIHDQREAEQRGQTQILQQLLQQLLTENSE